ncbi:MAG: adenylyl-sulfate kinase, partial [Planctomycetes bacterium]|nr:adenylyl-sulfate kinase [Planctomycetota bacterium]
GDNVAEPSANTLWYEDGSLLHVLENIYVGAERNLRPFRFPVQWVNRPDSRFRGFSGTIVSGSLKVGDEIVVLPSRKTSHIRRIVTHDGDLAEAGVDQSVTVTLTDEIDISRGDMIVHAESLPHQRCQADAMLVWMSEQAMVPGKPYWVKHTTRRTSGEVQCVRYAIDVNTLQHTSAAHLKLNEIGCCRLSLRDPLSIDAYQENRATGSFILVDRITHETVAAGMFLDPGADASGAAHWDDQPAGLRLQRVVSRIRSQERERRYGQKPFTLLITGLSASGKTTLAVELERRLFDAGKKCVLLDGQDMRFGISRDLGYSAEERSENLRRAAEIARTLNDAGLICIAAFVAPHDDVRQRARERIGPDRFFHVHLGTPMEVCRQRDTTGRYAAADQGELSSFPGVTFAYEAPGGADLEFSTEDLSSEAAASRVLDLLTSRIDPLPE